MKFIERNSIADLYKSLDTMNNIRMSECELSYEYELCDWEKPKCGSCKNILKKITPLMNLMERERNECNDKRS